METKQMILCDTNILIEVYRNNEKIIQAVKKIEQQNIVVSEVTCAELYFGARDKNELRIIAKDLDKLKVLPVNTFISGLAVKLVKDYSLSHKLSLPDAIIGATAIYHNLELFTLNLKDFIFLEDLKLFEI